MGLVKKAQQAKCERGKVQCNKQGWLHLEKAVFKFIRRLIAGKQGRKNNSGPAAGNSKAHTYQGAASMAGVCVG